MTEIPRIIHQIWFQLGSGPASPPPAYDEMRASWRRHHPDWEFMQWDYDSSLAFLQEHYPAAVPMFQAYKRPIFQIDAIRYFLLHHYGGFYVDTDVTCYRSLEPLRSHGVVLAVDRYIKQVNNNHFMGAMPQHPFFTECLHHLPQAALFQTKKDSYVSTMSVAGPFFLTNMRTLSRGKGGVRVLTLSEEREYLLHHENHSWKLAKSIVGDVVRGGLVVAGVVLGGFAVKKVIDG